MSNPIPKNTICLINLDEIENGQTKMVVVGTSEEDRAEFFKGSCVGHGKRTDGTVGPIHEISDQPVYQVDIG